MKLVLQETGVWIKNADTKATVVAAAFGVSSTFAVPRSVTASSLLTETGNGCVWLIWGGLLLLATLAAGMTMWNIYFALIPRTHSKAANRFSWSSLSTDFAQPPAAVGNDILVREAWGQAITLAGIANTKFKHLKRALTSFGLYLVVLLLLTIAAAVLGVGK